MNDEAEPKSGRRDDVGVMAVATVAMTTLLLAAPAMASAMRDMERSVKKVKEPPKQGE